MNRKLLLGCLFSWGLFFSTAHAGQESHGGNVLLCLDKEPVVLDYYNATLPALGNPQPILEDISGMSTDQVVELFRGKLVGTALGAEFEKAYALIGDYQSWAKARDLIDVNDQGLGYPVPRKCGLKQAAVRQGNAVLIDEEVAATISPSQLGMLVVHELLYYVATEHGKQDSSPVRGTVRQLMKKNLDPRGLYSATNGLGVKLFWEQLANAYYCRNDSAVCRELPSTGNLSRDGNKIRSGARKFGSFICDYDEVCNYAGGGSLPSGAYLKILAPDQFELYFSATEHATYFGGNQSIHFQ